MISLTLTEGYIDLDSTIIVDDDNITEWEVNIDQELITRNVKSIRTIYIDLSTKICQPPKVEGFLSCGSEDLWISFLKITS